ncbi:hypothetical protein BDF22DRAFT_673708 [Syncephalis plumigaleata]|nr:hypothetical protein BDF22DRAFT_673708 [Syncephalis plumigaleata]
MLSLCSIKAKLFARKTIVRYFPPSCFPLTLHSTFISNCHPMVYDMMTLDDFSYTKLFAVVYVALRSYEMIVPPRSEVEEREKRSKEIPQVNENYSFFTIGPFSKLGRRLFVLFVSMNFIGFLWSQSHIIVRFVARSIGMDDIDKLQRWSHIIPDIHIPYAPSMFQWNAVIVCVLAVEIRAWSMRELGRFFTFQLGVSKDQRIVQTGPYHYLYRLDFDGSCCVYLIVVPTLYDIIRPVVIALLEIVAKQNEFNGYLTETASSLLWLLNDQFACI